MAGQGVLRALCVAVNLEDFPKVLELVEQGMKNKEIARELGIRPGTVKIHLKHIFEKTGVRGRYGLALSVMREKGLLEMAPVH